MIKIDYLTNINANYPNDSIIRLSGFDLDDLDKLTNIIEKMIESKTSEFLADYDFVNIIQPALELEFVTGNEDVGIVQKNNAELKFTCILSIDSWRKVIEMVASQRERLHGYCWLYDLNTPIDFLLSQSGTW